MLRIVESDKTKNVGVHQFDLFWQKRYGVMKIIYSKAALSNFNKVLFYY